jgi:glycosyl hydrolase family 4
MKLAVVGAGSTYTPEVIDGLIRLRHILAVDDLALCDPAEERLAVVSGLARRMLDRAGHPAHVKTTGNLDEAVEGADVGGRRAPAPAPRFRSRLARQHRLQVRRRGDLGRPRGAR